MLSSLKKALFLKHYKFPPKTTDKAKIVFAHTHGFTIRSIANAFNFASNKICRVIQEYKKTGTIPKPINHQLTKLLP